MKVGFLQFPFCVFVGIIVRAAKECKGNNGKIQRKIQRLPSNVIGQLGCWLLDVDEMIGYDRAVSCFEGRKDEYIQTAEAVRVSTT